MKRTKLSERWKCQEIVREILNSYSKQLIFSAVKIQKECALREKIYATQAIATYLRVLVNLGFIIKVPSSKARLLYKMVSSIPQFTNEELNYQMSPIRQKYEGLTFVEEF